VQARLDKAEALLTLMGSEVERLGTANKMLGEERDAWSRRTMLVTSGLEETVEAAEFFKTALLRIRDECGQVCDTFEMCHHRACSASFNAWSIADAALRGETIESANAKAIAQFNKDRGGSSVTGSPINFSEVAGDIVVLNLVAT
jgi:hypothetical protein